MDGMFGQARRLCAVLATGALAACSSIGMDEPSSGSGSTLGNLLRYGSTTQPPLARNPDSPAADCPSVLVGEGRAAIKNGSNQISIANVARECIERQDGSVVVKIGVEGRALLGPGGRSGRFDVPVSFALVKGDTVLASRVKRTSVSIPADQAQASFTVVEGDMIVPKGTGEFDIVVGLGGGPTAAPAARRRRG